MNLGKYEVLDRLSILMENLDTHIIEHEVLQNEPDVKAKLTKALGDLYEVYNWAGACLDEGECKAE